MDFDGIKDFIDSVGDTVAVFGNEEAIRLYDEIKEIIDDWSSCDSDDIPDTVLTNWLNHRKRLILYQNWKYSQPTDDLGSNGKTIPK